MDETIPNRQDATLREDHAQLRMGHAPEMLAVLKNTILGLFARLGQPMLLRLDAHSLIISTTHSLLSWLKVGIRLCDSPAVLGGLHHEYLHVA